MLDRMVQEGLILRTEDPNDRRVKQVKLTEKGLETIHGSLRARQAWFPELAEALTDNEKEQISEALNILIHKAQSLENYPTDKILPIDINIQEQQ